jgi:hypothetical protein
MRILVVRGYTDDDYDNDNNNRIKYRTYNNWKLRVN